MGEPHGPGTFESRRPLPPPLPTPLTLHNITPPPLGVTQEKPEFFGELRRGHAPKILWIGCSDARVPANEVIGEPPGSVFVHRNIANMVVNTDFNCMSVIQYAVSVLKVKHIIVCGHYDCGGVKASLEAADHRSPLINWLRNVRDTYRLHREELNALPDLRARQRRLVELNVIEQCVNVMKTAVVQRARVQSRKLKGVPGTGITFTQPRVHGMVYEPTTGEAKFLDMLVRAPAAVAFGSNPLLSSLPHPTTFPPIAAASNKSWRTCPRSTTCTAPSGATNQRVVCFDRVVAVVHFS